jgi:hypothetical protein
MKVTTKAVSATITDTSSDATEFPGTFEVELSNETTDRDGDTLKAADWELPLPEQITFVNDHTHKMASVVGSAKPELVGDKIICKGVWGATPNAQETRVISPHVPYVSVAYAEKSNGKRELINGAFVVVPSNPTARLLASKSIGDLPEDTLLSELTVKQFTELLGTKEVSPTPEGAPDDSADPEPADPVKVKAAAQAMAAAFEMTSATDLFEDQEQEQ